MNNAFAAAKMHVTTFCSGANSQHDSKGPYMSTATIQRARGPSDCSNLIRIHYQYLLAINFIHRGIHGTRIRLEYYPVA